MPAVLLITLLTAQDPAALSECGLSFANESALRAIATASSSSELDVLQHKVPLRDSISRLFFASRLSVLAPGSAADAALVAALPNRKRDVDLMYTFTYGCSAPPSLTAFGGGSWIPQAREAVIRQRKGVRAFLMLSWLYRSNADIGESLPEDIEAIRTALPDLFASAFRRLPRVVRNHITGGRELLPEP